MPTAAAPASCARNRLRRRPAPAMRYGIAGAAVLIAALANQALRPVTHAPESPLFVAAVLVTSWLGGLGPGLVATGLSVVVLDVVMSPGPHSFVVNEDVLARLSVFLVVAVFSSALDAARRRAAAERARALERERAARADAEAANRAKDDFVAMVAHELRTPLTGTSGSTPASAPTPCTPSSATSRSRRVSSRTSSIWPASPTARCRCGSAPSTSMTSSSPPSRRRRRSPTRAGSASISRRRRRAHGCGPMRLACGGRSTTSS